MGDEEARELEIDAAHYDLNTWGNTASAISRE